MARKNMIEADLRFHAIGQGCFYTGNLSGQNGTYRFVYDCGSNSSRTHINESVRVYRDRLGNNAIDLVIVSHYDFDHVNCIKDLITGKHVRQLIIPYVETIERLFIYAKSDSTDEDYRTLIRDPLGYFANDDKFRIDEIIVLGGPDYKSPEAPVPVQPTDLRSNLSAEFSSHIVGKEAKVPSGNSFFASIGKGTTSIKFYEIPFQVILTEIWEFRFYLKDRANQDLIDGFNVKLNSIKNELNIHDYEDLFTNEARRKIKDAYQEYFRDVNSTSLVVFSGPIQEAGRIRGYIDFFYPTIWNPFQPMIYPAGTLLTGDINVKRNLNLQDLAAYFTNYLPKISVFQVPHHGSQRNWNFNHPNGFDDFSFYVINHGIGRKHHPSARVVADINAETEGIPFLNNESQDFRLQFLIR